MKRKILSLMKLYDIESLEVSAALSMGRTTFYSRLNHPDNFTVGELRVLSDKLHISINDLIEAAA